MTKNILLLFTILGATSCSSLRDSLLTGVGTGAALGAGAGTLAIPKTRKKGALTGALVGAAVGGLSSYFLYRGAKSKEERIRRDTLFNLDKHNVLAPKGFSAQRSRGHGVSMPVVESEWVETQVKGKKLIEGHRIWFITEEAQWVPDSKRKMDEGNQ